jgi:hypothetical protein
MITIDDKVTFDPFGEITGFGSEDNKGNYVTGNVVYVNYGHQWFLVEYGEPKMRTSFKFCELGKAVKICG